MKDLLMSRRPSREPGRGPRGFLALMGNGSDPGFDWVFPIRFGRPPRPYVKTKVRPVSFPGRPFGPY
jgi:hypothetical protein